MKEIRAEEYFSIGFELGKKQYWTIFFNFLVYAVLALVASSNNYLYFLLVYLAFFLLEDLTLVIRPFSRVITTEIIRVRNSLF